MLRWLQSAPVGLVRWRWTLLVKAMQVRRGSDRSDERQVAPVGGGLAAGEPYQTTTGVKAAETTKEKVQLDIVGLKPWPQIPALKDVSGVGTYTANFELPSDWKSGYGALLKLGEVFDSFTLVSQWEERSG